MKEQLREIGLTNGEVEIYLALLKLGPSTNSPIAKRTGLQSSTVYYCLNSLIEKGFVSYIIKQNRKNYIATSPENIISIMEEKEAELKKQKRRMSKVIPKLQEYSAERQEESSAEVYEGMKGFKAIFNQIIEELNRGDNYEAFVINQSHAESEEIVLFLTQYNKRLRKKGIHVKLLGSISLKKIFEKIYGKRFMKKYFEIRYIDDIIPVGITLYKNYTITHVVEEDEKPVSFKIRNRELTQNYRDYFYSVWDKAKN